MWNGGCGMWNVGCGMWNVGCGIWNGACGTGMFSHRSQMSTETMRGALSKKHETRRSPSDQRKVIAPMRTDGSFHGLFTLAPLPTAWVSMRRRRNGSTRIFSQAESCVGECHTMGLLGMRKICGNPRDLWATNKRTMR